MCAAETRTRSPRSSSNLQAAEVTCRRKRRRGWNGRHFLGGGGGRQQKRREIGLDEGRGEETTV
ncbi:hypothetical protein F2Q68_00011652 [Brassica cretica]|uniref:Uncharacterized protein n=1 Tax=Brassica cretica TaxID=69181 RepID=A0A8S9KS89_BRACR|nr:hypothetical protein F2Q68_00011652 [Brassica cretica]KAF3538117.1 hypothetical protein F2Q69_00024527 [Brassica cretica]